MGKGKAYGEDRKYQEDCRDFLIRTQQGLIPYAGDGCDVSFKIGGTTWTVDVALMDTLGNLVVAECRRRTAPAKQSEIAAFAYQVELLRKSLSTDVSGVFFTKTAVQIGAVKVGTYESIKLVVLAEGIDPSEGFSAVFHRYDDQRERRLKDYLMTAESGHFQVKGGEVRFSIKRKHL